MQGKGVINRLEGIRSKQPWLVLSAENMFSVAGSTNPVISHFYSFETSKTVQETMAIPDGCVDIIFDCDGSQPNAEVFGTPMSAIDIELESEHRYFGVRFASGVIPDCLQVSAQELISHHFSLLDVVPSANQLFEAVVENANFVDQVSSFKQFFDINHPRQLSPLTQAVVALIVTRQGNIRIDELAESTGYTTRTIQRLFRANMGMSPKQFGRIIRCQSAVYSINHGEGLRFSDLACDLGFSDQPHFLKEFKKLVSITPLDYLKRIKHETYLDKIRYF